MTGPFERPLLLTKLQLLFSVGVWTIAEATAQLGPLQQLKDDLQIIVATRPIGRFVVLGPAGRRTIGLDPHVHISIDAAENRLYLRQAAIYFGWELTRERYRGAMQDVGILDRQALALIDTLPVRVIAKCTGDGYSSAVVSRLERKLRATMLFHRERLVVVTPSRQRLQRMDDRNGMLEIVRFPIEAARVGG